MKKRMIILGAVLVAGAIGWGIWSKAHRREHFGSFYGNIDIREVTLGFRVGGKISQVLHEEGDEVKEGDELARLDSAPYRREVEEAKAQVAALRARLQLLETGNRPQEIDQARALVNERQVTAANAGRLFKRQEELLANRAVSVQDRDDAEARYREAEARLRSGREQLALLEAGFRPEEIAQARAELARAEAALASAELRLADTSLTSPSHGVILTRAQEGGAIVQPGAAVLTLSLTEPVWVRAYVAEPQLGRIYPGMPVLVFTDSRPEKPYPGQIGFISPRAEFTPKNVKTPELRTSLVYRFRVVVSDPDGGLRQGMPVTVRVVSGGEGARGNGTRVH